MQSKEVKCIEEVIDVVRNEYNFKVIRKYRTRTDSVPYMNGMHEESKREVRITLILNVLTITSDICENCVLFYFQPTRECVNAL